MKVGLDIGYSSVKIAYGEGREPELLRLPIGAAPINQCGFQIDGAAAVGAGHVVTINGAKWVAAVEPARLSGFMPTMDDSYSSTDEYRALFYASLSAIGSTRIDCLVTGLPVTHYRDEAMRKRLQQLMKGTHLIREGLTVEVDEVMVVPQPAGAYGASMLDAMLGKTDLRIAGGTSVLVVDPGHYSLDWVIYKGAFDMDSAGSTSHAGEVVVKRAAELLSKLHSIRVLPHKLQDAVNSGSAQPLLIGDHEIDFWPALHEVAGEIVRYNLKALRGSVRGVTDQRGVDIVLIGGGGAGLFHTALKDSFPEAKVVSVRDSISANARGFFAAAGQMKKAA